MASSRFPRTKTVFPREVCRFPYPFLVVEAPPVLSYHGVVFLAPCRALLLGCAIGVEVVELAAGDGGRGKARCPGSHAIEATSSP